MFRIDNTYNTFISHSWAYNSDYEFVLNSLRESNINVRDFSVSINDPFGPMANSKLKDSITGQIQYASVFIILAGMYSAYSNWIDYEINESIRLGKPILAVCPWGQERVPVKIQDCANQIVRWNSSSIVDGFKSLV